MKGATDGKTNEQVNGCVVLVAHCWEKGDINPQMRMQTIVDDGRGRKKETPQVTQVEMLNIVENDR